jgi:hypothetical protein
MTPPETGNMVPSSAYTSPISTIAMAPMTHEKMAAGPAIADAFIAPNSQPEPMIDPTLAKSSPTMPMWRRILVFVPELAGPLAPDFVRVVIVHALLSFLGRYPKDR